MSRPRVPIRWVVLVTGSREWSDYERMARCLERYPEGTLVIHGGARGADEMAGVIARTYRFRELSEEYFGDLGILGGPARNDLLIDLALTYVRHGYTVIVEAFPTTPSRGTWDCVNKARNAGLQVEITHG